jgi:hypothetical protein
MMFALVLGLGLLGFAGTAPSFAESPAYNKGYSDGSKAGYEDGYKNAYRMSFNDSLTGYGTMSLEY